MNQAPDKQIVEDEGYFKVTRENLLRDLSDPSRVKAETEMTATLKIERVLDVGCGIGQALFPLAVSSNAVGIGADVSGLGLRMGRDFYAEHLPGAKVTFIQSKGESLPFDSESFDVVHCGLALPYMDNARAIAEMARVLRPGGLFLLKIHHTRYYLHEFWRGVTSRRLSAMIYSGRVLAAGVIYHLARRQPRVHLLNETFQTRWMLSRELAKHKMTIEREQPNSNPLTPAFIIHKAL